LRQLLQDAYN